MHFGARLGVETLPFLIPHTFYVMPNTVVLGNKQNTYKALSGMCVVSVRGSGSYNNKRFFTFPFLIFVMAQNSGVSPS